MSVKDFAKLIKTSYQGVFYHIQQKQGYGLLFKKGLDGKLAISEKDALKVIKDLNK